MKQIFQTISFHKPMQYRDRICTERMGFPENWEEIEAINIDGNAKSDNQ